MSNPTQAVPTELMLSPSKARAHATTSQAWSQVTSWLSTLFQSSTAPPCERDPSTLAYLQSLMHANASADETRKLLLAAQREQVECYERYHDAVQGRPERELSQDIERDLSVEGKGAVEELARVVVRLGVSNFARRGTEGSGELMTAMGKRVQRLTVQLFEMQNRIEELSVLRQHFERELRESREAVIDLEATSTGPDAEAELERIQMQVAQYVRETKQISLKMDEYHDRILALSKQVDDQQGPTIEEVRDRETQVERRREDVRRLEEKMRQFNSLPPDVDASREEVKRAGSELERWRQKREELFERM